MCVLVTVATIQAALVGADLRPLQRKASIPLIEEYANRALNGEIPPAIRVCDDLIVDGVHRYVASRLAGTDLAQTPWERSISPESVDWNQVEWDEVRWPQA